MRYSADGLGDPADQDQVLIPLQPFILLRIQIIVDEYYGVINSTVRDIDRDPVSVRPDPRDDVFCDLLLLSFFLHN